MSMKFGKHTNADEVIANLPVSDPRFYDDNGKIKIARIQLNSHPELHEQFKKISFNRDEEMSDLITEFVINYVNANGFEVSEEKRQMYMDKPKNWK
ncbi:hypothetical protein EE88_21590 [Salmonella enterica]|nr:hypothetical protein [Salmonella enterica]